MAARVSIQTEDFDVAAEIAALRRDDAGVGAVCSFIGTVRDRNDGSAGQRDGAGALPRHDREGDRADDRRGACAASTSAACA